jgi:hypothetical protein
MQDMKDMNKYLLPILLRLLRCGYFYAFKQAFFGFPGRPGLQEAGKAGGRSV